MPDVTSPHDYFWTKAAQATLSSGAVDQVTNVHCEMEQFEIISPGTLLYDIIHYQHTV